MPTNVHYRKSVDAEFVGASVVILEAVIRNSVAVVAAPLLPGAVLGLPALRAIDLPGNLLLLCLVRSALLLSGVVVIPLYLMLPILLHADLFLSLSGVVVLPLLLLFSLLILLLHGNLLLLFV